MAKDALADRTRPLVGRWILLAAVGLAAGCAPDASAPASFSAAAEQADAQFQAGANRPPTAKTLYAMAKILATQGKDPQCEYVLKRTIRDYPDCLPAYCDLAELQVRQRRITDAVDTLKMGLTRSPKDSVLLNNLGMTHMLRAEYDAALDLFARASGVRPQDARYRANMAAALGMLGRYDESLALYAQVVPAAEAHHNIGVLAKARRDTVRAASESKKAEMLAAANGKKR